MRFAFSSSDLLAYSVLAVLALILLGVGVVLLVGLFQARSLLWREFSAYFLSPIAYVVLVLFLLVTGHLFYQALEQLTASGPKGVEYPMQVMLGDERFWLVFLFIPPLLTMRLFAEERSTGTLEMLMTAPVRDWQVVLTKYLACYAFYVLLWLPTLVYLPVLLDLQPPVFNPVWTVYTIVLLSGLGALLFCFLLLLLPAGTNVRALMFGLLLGIVCAGGGAYVYSQTEANAPLRIVATMLGAFGIGSILLCLLVALMQPLERAMPYIILLLFVASLVAIAVGAWGHYHVERLADGNEFKPLVEVPARIDPMPVLSSYLGLALAGAMFLALGMLVSSLVRSQMVAALLSLILSLVFIVAGFWRPEMDSSNPIHQLIYFFSVPLHFSRDFSRGLVDTRHLVLYGSVALFCIFLTVRSLESRRWR